MLDLRWLLAFKFEKAQSEFSNLTTIVKVHVHVHIAKRQRVPQQHGKCSKKTLQNKRSIIQWTCSRRIAASTTQHRDEQQSYQQYNSTSSCCYLSTWAPWRRRSCRGSWSWSPGSGCCRSRGTTWVARCRDPSLYATQQTNDEIQAFKTNLRIISYELKMFAGGSRAQSGKAYAKFDRRCKHITCTSIAPNFWQQLTPRVRMSYGPHAFNCKVSTQNQLLLQTHSSAFTVTFKTAPLIGQLFTVESIIIGCVTGRQHNAMTSINIFVIVM